jgi:hypothetical protein
MTGEGELGVSMVEVDMDGVGAGGLESKLNLNVEERVALDEEAETTLSCGT